MHNLPPISYNSDRFVFEADPSKPRANENLYNRVVREAVYKKDFTFPTMSKPCFSYTKPTVSLLSHIHDDRSDPENNFYNRLFHDVYNTPISTSIFHDNISWGLVNEFELIKYDFDTKKWTIMNITLSNVDERYSTFFPVTRWSEWVSNELACLQYTYSTGVPSPRDAPISYDINILHIRPDNTFSHSRTHSRNHSVMPQVLEWKDRFCLWVGDVSGDLSLYDFRMSRAAQSVGILRGARGLIRISPCGNHIATGFISNHVVISDVRKLETALSSYKSRAGVLGLKYVKPDLMITGTGTADQCVRLFDPTESGDLTPFWTSKRLGQVTAVETIGNQIIVGGGYNNNGAVSFYRYNGRMRSSSYLDRIEKGKNKFRVTQLVLNKDNDKVFCLAVNDHIADVVEITPPQVVKNETKRSRGRFYEIR